MCFQVCSNSTYPQHSGERYRTNGPLVYYYYKQLKIAVVVATVNNSIAVASSTGEKTASRWKIW